MAVNNNCFKDAVCIDAGRVYDSCCDRDCLEDLRVCFGEAEQAKVENAVNVRCRSAEIVNVEISVEPVTFNRGFYAVDMTFYFCVVCDLFECNDQAPDTVTGFAVWNKKVILCGGEGSAKVYSSEYTPGGSIQLPMTANLPKAYVQTVDPVVLAAEIKCSKCCEDECPCRIPGYITERLRCQPFFGPARRYVAVTLGVFSVVQLIRNVQMLIPVYDFCVPEKECVSTTDDPCELFKRLRFPVDEFFPSDDVCSENQSEGCTACG